MESRPDRRVPHGHVQPAPESRSTTVRNDPPHPGRCIRAQAGTLTTFRITHTVEAPTRWPSPASSPWTRRYPSRGSPRPVVSPVPADRSGVEGRPGGRLPVVVRRRVTRRRCQPQDRVRRHEHADRRASGSRSASAAMIARSAHVNRGRPPGDAAPRADGAGRGSRRPSPGPNGPTAPVHRPDDERSGTPAASPSGDHPDPRPHRQHPSSTPARRVRAPTGCTRTGTRTPSPRSAPRRVGPAQ